MNKCIFAAWFSVLIY